MNYRLCAFGLVALQSGLAGMSLSPALANGPTVAASSLSRTEATALVFNQANAADRFSGQGRPRRRTSGGSRGPCGDRLVALLPGTDTLSAETAECSVASTAQPAVTLSSNPTLWFYIPASEGATAELVLLDDNAREIATEHITLPTEPGLVGVQLNHPLEAGKPYRWVFSLLVNPNSPSQNPTVEGSLRRVVPEAGLTAALETAETPQARAQLFAQQGIWHDALNAVAQLRKSNPDSSSITQDWIALLSSVGLEAIAEETLLN